MEQEDDRSKDIFGREKGVISNEKLDYEKKSEDYHHYHCYN